LCLFNEHRLPARCDFALRALQETRAIAAAAGFQFVQPFADVPNTMNGESILIVEDDAVVSRALTKRFRAAGYKVVAAGTSADAIRATVIQQPDLMILDLTLVQNELAGLNDGLGLLQWLRYSLPEAKFPVIIHTGDSSHNVERRARAAGVDAIFRKGDSPGELLATVREVLDAHKETSNPKP
jgi:DNA-binding response OmpR family regulator